MLALRMKYKHATRVAAATQAFFKFQNDCVWIEFIASFISSIIKTQEGSCDF